ncbi:hypothetical protein GCM10009759_36440 [Kitasatospora saccharophila]|uniref:trans-2-enoyl-CoA reductase (NAD(+)) n=1 Tax=Kitasatospora saccharophila TaxID=407973 RepID=A0ABN2X0Z8_9ACTN
MAVDPGTHARGRAPVVLLLGSSAGYGLSILLAGLRQHGIRGIGVAYEGALSERRTATAGWYRTATVARLAAENGSDFVFLNADAFSAGAKERVLDLVAERYGPVDHLVYSLAAPRRTDPVTSEVHHLVIKPVGGAYEAASPVFPDGAASIGAVRLAAASEEERRATVKAMGGENWRLWADGVLAGGAGRAFTVVAGVAVTQASTAIPSIALYTSLLRNVFGADGWRTTTDQAVDLWEQLAGERPLLLDGQGRIRLDGWESDEEVQTRVRARWADSVAALAADPAGSAWFHQQSGSCTAVTCPASTTPPRPRPRRPGPPPRSP